MSGAGPTDGAAPAAGPTGMFSNPLVNSAPQAPQGAQDPGMSNPMFGSASTPYMAPQIIQQPSTSAPPRSGPMTLPERMAQFQANGGHK